MILPERIALHLVEALDRHAPARMAVIGETIPQVVRRWVEAAPQRALDHLDATTPAALVPIGRVDVAVAVAPLARRLEQVLARLRDLHAARVLVVEPALRECLERVDTEIRALAFQRLAAQVVDARRAVLLYGYDIATYKRTPDWLNARHWANPEQWGRHRW